MTQLGKCLFTCATQPLKACTLAPNSLLEPTFSGLQSHIFLFNKLLSWDPLVCFMILSRLHLVFLLVPWDSVDSSTPLLGPRPWTRFLHSNPHSICLVAHLYAQHWLWLVSFSFPVSLIISPNLRTWPLISQQSSTTTFNSMVEPFTDIHRWLLPIAMNITGPPRVLLQLTWTASS